MDICSSFISEKEMATTSSILAWKIPWTEEPGRLQFIGSQESDTTTKQQLKTTKGHLDCFQVWAVMNKAAVNFGCRLLCGPKFSTPLGKYQGA